MAGHERFNDSANANASLDLMKEVRYIQQLASERNSRIVTLNELLLFSTQSGDAWILDTQDKLAMKLARNGDPLTASIDGSDDSFEIVWSGRYRIDGLVFIYVEESAGSIEPMTGYPVQQILQRTRKASPALLSVDREADDLLHRLRKQTGRE